jgi:hypothetical protein
MIAAFAAIAAGLLVHYMAGPYLVVLAAHYMISQFWKRPDKWRELATIVLSSAVLLAPWFAWSIATYGPHATFQSNTSITSSQAYQGNNVVKMAANLFDSIVPFPLRGQRLYSDEPNRWGLLRDNAFALYQVNLILGMGLVGGPLVLWLLYRLLRSGKSRQYPEWRFWRVLVPVCVLIGCAVVGERDVLGTAHLTLLPLEMLGLTLIASIFPWRRAMAAAIFAGLAIDFSLGVFLQAQMEALENSPGHAVFSVAARLSDGGLQPAAPAPDSLSVAAWENWSAKHLFTVSRQFLSNFQNFQAPDAESQATAARVVAAMEANLRQDLTNWQGWWSRHNYTLDFLGDDVWEAEGSGLLPVVVISLFLLITAALIREMRPRPVKLAVSVATGKGRRS